MMLTSKEFPKDMGSLPIDFTNTKKCLVSGLFSETAEVHGKKRRFYTYIAPNLTYNQPCLIIASPDDVPTAEFIENGFWQKSIKCSFTSWNQTAYGTWTAQMQIT